MSRYIPQLTNFQLSSTTERRVEYWDFNDDMGENNRYEINLLFNHIYMSL